MNEEKIYIEKQEYNFLKQQDEDLYKMKRADFVIKIYSGAVVPSTHPNYNNDRIKIEIFSFDFIKLGDYLIQIDGKEYNIKSQNLFNNIKKFVSDNLDVLIGWSKHQTNFNLNSNGYEGGKSRSIQIKYGQLVINVNGQVSDLGSLCDEFINEIKTMIITDGDKTNENFIEENMNKILSTPLPPVDVEFENYCKLYQDRFGKKAYIAEPGGTREKTIEAIKICLDKNEDLLDKLLYPNDDGNILF